MNVAGSINSEDKTVSATTNVSYAGIRKAYKSTKSTDDGEQAPTNKGNDSLPQYMLSPEGDLKMHDGLPLTHRQRCQRIIDQAFGKSDNTQPDRVLNQQYCSHSVNLEDTRREIHESEKEKLKLQEQKIPTDNTNSLLADDRHGAFKMSRELNLFDDNQDEIIITQSSSAKDSDLTKNSENVKETAEKTPPVEETNLSEPKENLDKCVTNPESTDKKTLCVEDVQTIEVVKDERNPDLCQQAVITNQPHVPWFLNATTARETNLPYAKEDVDVSVSNPESIEKKAFCDGDAETIKVVKDARKRDLYQEVTPNDQLHTPQVLYATTAKQEEELLTQKLETIEETPIVEAHHPKLGGNVTPRVNDQPHTLQVLNATIAKQEDELLTQKQENIEATPIVVAHNPKREGNVTSRVLGNEPTLNCKVITYTQATPNDQPHSPQVLRATTAKQVEELLNKHLKIIEQTPIVETHNPKPEGNVIPRVNDRPHTPQVLNATTAKQEEELLTQKQETIEETPLVEAHNPKREWNVTPRVLGNEPTFNCKVIKNTQDTPNDQPHTPQVLETVEVVKDERKPDLYQKAIINNQPHVPWFLNASNARETNLTYAKEDVDVSVSNPESIEKKAFCDGDAETIKVVKDERKRDLYQEVTPNDQLHAPQVLNATTAKQEEELLTQKLETIEETPIVEAHHPKLGGNVTPRVNDQPHTPQVLNATTAKQVEELFNKNLKIIKQTPIAEAYNPKPKGNVIPRVNDRPHTPQILNASTAKQEEELLTQKLETIEETVIIEAQLKRNVTPRVLGNVQPTLNCKVPPIVNLPGALDEVSKRCLNCPLGQVDEMLINEMEKLGITYKTAQEAPSTPIEDDLVQMDEQEILCERPVLEEKVIERGTDTMKPDVNELPEALRKSEEVVKPVIDLQSPSYKGQDPVENYNSTTKLACNYLPPTHRETKLDSMDSEKVSLPEQLLKERTLNPYYVLTCNETCPISPGCTMSFCQNSDFVDTTETIYMKKNICESVRPKPQPTMRCEKMLQLPPNEMKVGPETTPEIHARGVPEIKCKNIQVEIEMPKLNEQISLTELLRRVRQKSRLAYSQTKVGKCGSKSPQCNPVGPRSPPNNPVPKPTFGLPMLKRRPPVCPKRNKPCIKCSRDTNCPETPYELNETEVCAERPNVNLTDEVFDRLQNIGKILVRVLQKEKFNVETLSVRDYEPWAPIPSWNIPKKIKKKEWRPGMTGLPPCVRGCPNFPKARASMNPEPPCNLKPCEGFPKRRSFSMLDYFRITLGENIVYNLGDF